MEPLTLALSLAKFVPDIVGYFKGDKAKDAASTIVNIAENATGLKQDKALEAIESNPEMAFRFKELVLKDKYTLDSMYLHDTQDAREMYKHQSEAADRIAHFIMRFNLPAVAGLLVLQVVAMLFLKNNAEVLALVSTSVGFVINALLNERQQVAGFFFGSSLGSKAKGLK